MTCINYLPPLEEAATLLQVHAVVQRLLNQYHLTYFQELYPDATYTELGEILEEECDADPDMVAVAYFLYFADKQRAKLLAMSGAGN